MICTEQHLRTKESERNGLVYKKKRKKKEGTSRLRIAHKHVIARRRAQSYSKKMPLLVTRHFSNQLMFLPVDRCEEENLTGFTAACNGLYWSFTHDKGN